MVFLYTNATFACLKREVFTSQFKTIDIYTYGFSEYIKNVFNIFLILLEQISGGCEL